MAKEQMFKFQSRVNTFGDVMRNYLWKISFDKLPTAITQNGGVKNLSGLAIGGALDEDSLTYLARECSIPSVSMSSVIESSFLNWKRRYPSKFEFTGELAVTFEEFESLRLNSILYAWQQAIQSSESGASLANATGNEKADLVTDAYIQLYHFNGEKLASRIKMVNVFIKDIQEVQLTYADSQGVQLSTSFAYDYWEWVPSAGN